MQTINERIVFLRKYKSLKQNEFSKLVGIPRSSMSEIENGKRCPNIEFIVRISNKFEDISMDWLLTGKGTMLREEPKTSPEAIDPAVMGVVSPDAILSRCTIDIDQQEIAQWRQQGQIPYEACERIAKQQNVSLKWLITGFGDKNSTDTIDRRLYIMNQLMESLPENQQQDFLSALQEKERINQIERELAELKAKR